MKSKQILFLLITLLILTPQVKSEEFEKNQYNEICFCVDVSNSMFSPNNPQTIETFNDILCFIRNKIKKIEDPNTAIYFNFFASDTMIYRFYPPLKKRKTVEFVDQVNEMITKAQKKNKSFFIYTNISEAISASFDLFKSDPKDFFQEIYLFTDVNTSLYSTKATTFDFPELYEKMEKEKATPKDLRNLYYYPILTKLDPKIDKVVKIEGGATFEDMANKLCGELTFVYATIKVLDHMNLPFPDANIVSNQSSGIMRTAEDGIYYYRAKTFLPSLIQFKIGYTGFENNYTHVRIESLNKISFDLAPVRLQKTPIKFLIAISDADLDYEQNNINGCVLFVDNYTERFEYEIPVSPREILFYDLPQRTDSLMFTVSRRGYQKKDLVVYLEKWKNYYPVYIELKRK